MKDIIELPEESYNNVILANVIEECIPVYVEIAKKNPEGLDNFWEITNAQMYRYTYPPLVIEALKKIEEHKDSPNLGEIVEKTLTELVKKLREVSVDSRSDAEGTVVDADDKLGGSYGENSVKLGVFLIKVDADVQRRYRLDTDYGMLVYRVRKLSPAANAGLSAQDVIIDINGKKVDNPKTFTFAINEACKSNKKDISMTVKRMNEIKEVSVNME